MGNQMFLIATLYAIARDCKFPLVDNSLGYYFQSPEHFINYESEIKAMFGDGIPKKTDMIAVHVRRGGNPINPNEVNYSDNSFYVNLSETSYYERAMQKFVNDAGGNLSESDFLIFSDDIEWCKKQRMFSGCEFSEGKDELEDLNLMASCIGHITANSSYSWWAAYIAPYTYKVIAPLAWYSDGDQKRTKCPTEWIRM